MAPDPRQQRRELRIQSASFRERSQLLREQQSPELQSMLTLMAQLPDDADVNREALLAALAGASGFLRAHYEVFSSSFSTLSNLFAVLAESTGTDPVEEVEDLQEQARALRECAEILDYLILVAKVPRDSARLLARDQ